jgi:DNA-binding response OmpR family regulator
MPATVLICDDEQILRQLVQAALAENDYSIVEARDGDEALALARSVCPNLILLDMMMPGRGGLDVLVELRGDTSFDDTPIVMLTARAQAVDQAAVLGAGADLYLPKPFSVFELVSVVEQLLGARHAPVGPVGQGSAWAR